MLALAFLIAVVVVSRWLLDDRWLSAAGLAVSVVGGAAAYSLVLWRTGELDRELLRALRWIGRD